MDDLLTVQNIRQTSRYWSSAPLIYLWLAEVFGARAVIAPHRHAAFEACEYVIVRLKEIVPIWKKEFYTDGAVWIGSENEYPRGEVGSTSDEVRSTK